jgi:hypothetical protein
VVPRAFLVRIAPWWVACLIIGSFLPGAIKDALGTTNPLSEMAHGRAVLAHRLVHFTSFGSTALILMLIAETRAQQLAAGLGVAILGLMLECSQFSLLSLKYMEWWDVRDDALAACGSLVLIQWAGFRRAIVADKSSKPGE